MTANLETLTQLNAWLALRAGVFIEGTLTPVRDEVLVDGAARAVFEPLRLRPGVLFGPSITL